MNYKNRHIKQICLVGIIALIAFNVVYKPVNNITDTKKLIPLDSNIAPQVSTMTHCLPNNVCDDTTKLSIETKPLLISQPVVAIHSITIQNPPVKNEPLDVVEYPSVSQLQGKNILNFQNFVNKDSHQCTMEFNQDSVLQINQILEQLSEEIVLNKSTYQVNRYLDLNIISPQISDRFNDKLVHKIQLVLEIYRRSFNLNLLKKNEVNLVILPSKEAYVDFIENLSLNSDRSQGLFWSRSNYAFVAFKNEEQAAEVALHEAIHSIHFSLVGRLSRWLDEGLAQFFSGIQIIQENRRSRFWMKTSYSENDLVPMTLKNLIEGEEQWNTSERDHLYSSSYAFVNYFFDQRKVINIIGNLLLEESKNPCSALLESHYLEVIDERLYNFRSDFDDWLDKEIKKIN